MYNYMSEMSIESGKPTATSLLGLSNLGHSHRLRVFEALNYYRTFVYSSPLELFSQHCLRREHAFSHWVFFYGD